MSLQNFMAKKATGSVSKSAAKATVKNDKKASKAKKHVDVDEDEDGEDVKTYAPKILDDRFQIKVVEHEGREFLQILCPIDTEDYDADDDVEFEHGYSDNGFRLSSKGKSENLVNTGGSMLIPKLPKAMRELFGKRQVYLNVLMTSPLKINKHLKF